jgi:hypothetical protein
VAVVAVTNLKQKLTLATTALLAGGAQAETDTEDAKLYNKWNVDAGYLHYNEPDYITVDTYMAMINGDLSDKDTIGLGLVFDTLSGATPTGALPGSESVTVSGVSGGGFSAGGGKGGTAPFDDTRLAVDATWGHEWKRLLTSKAGLHISVEGDYTSAGASLAVEMDSKDKSRTLTLGVGTASDKVSRSNEQTPSPLTGSAAGVMFGVGHKSTYDAMIGITKVINRRTVGMLNFTYSQSLGYHTDPYKVISVADDQDDELGTLFEKRPDTRQRYIAYGKINHELPNSGHHISLSYRLHVDSWDLNSHTLEGSYSFPVLKTHKLEPFARLYQQQAANFHTRTLPYSGDPNITIDNYILPQEFASADARLAQMQSTTIGAKFRYMTSEKGSIDIRLAYYFREYKDSILTSDDAVFAVIDFGKIFE